MKLIFALMLIVTVITVDAKKDKTHGQENSHSHGPHTNHTHSHDNHGASNRPKRQAPETHGQSGSHSHVPKTDQSQSQDNPDASTGDLSMAVSMSSVYRSVSTDNPLLDLGNQDTTHISVPDHTINGDGHHHHGNHSKHHHHHHHHHRHHPDHENQTSEK